MPKGAKRKSKGLGKRNVGGGNNKSKANKRAARSGVQTRHIDQVSCHVPVHKACTPPTTQAFVSNTRSVQSLSSPSKLAAHRVTCSLLMLCRSGRTLGSKSTSSQSLTARDWVQLAPPTGAQYSAGPSVLAQSLYGWQKLTLQELQDRIGRRPASTGNPHLHSMQPILHIAHGPCRARAKQASQA